VDRNWQFLSVSVD